MFCCLQSPKGTVTNQQVKEEGRSWFVCFVPQRPPAGNPLPNSNLSKLSSLELNVCPNPSKRLKCPPNSRPSLPREPAHNTAQLDATCPGSCPAALESAGRARPPFRGPAVQPGDPAPSSLRGSPYSERRSASSPKREGSARPPVPRERGHLAPTPGLLSPGQRPATPPADKG